MNNKRRTIVRQIIDSLSTVVDEIENVRDEEDDCLSALENFEGTERYTTMEENVENLESALDSVQEAIGSLEEIV